MLKGILAPERCAECKGCCYFDSTDFWEIPYIMPELAGYIKSNYPSAGLKSCGNGVYKFSHNERTDKNGVFVCPMLSENGCILGDNKPFDCRIYPFRIMKDKDGTDRIAVSAYCKTVTDMDFEDIKRFLYSSGLYDRIMEYRDENPAAVIGYTESYKIII